MLVPTEEDGGLYRRTGPGSCLFGGAAARLTRQAGDSDDTSVRPNRDTHLDLVPNWVLGMTTLCAKAVSIHQRAYQVHGTV